MNEITEYCEAVRLAKSILHKSRNETTNDAARIVRFMASQETEDVPKLLAEIERLQTELYYATRHERVVFDDQSDL